MNRSSDRVIFFDIDGVMLPGRAFAIPENKELLNAKLPQMQRMEMAKFQPEAIACLYNLCNQTSSKLVLMSSWGQAWWDRPMDLQDRFVMQGVKRDHFHDDWCPFGPGYEFRKHPKVLEWLAAHNAESFVIIDDEPHLYQDEGLADVKHAVIKTDPKIGLTQDQVTEATIVLSKFGRAPA